MIDNINVLMYCTTNSASVGGSSGRCKATNPETH